MVRNRFFEELHAVAAGAEPKGLIRDPVRNVRIELPNVRRKLVKEVEFPRGHARNPMTDAEVEHKFRTLVEPRYGQERTTKILQTCWDLEKVTSVTTLLRLFD